MWELRNLFRKTRGGKEGAGWGGGLKREKGSERKMGESEREIKIINFDLDWILLYYTSFF